MEELLQKLTELWNRFTSHVHDGVDAPLINKAANGLSSPPSVLTAWIMPTIPGDPVTPVDSATVTGTQAIVGLFNLPAQITVNKISIHCASSSVNGTYDITIYSENGQTQKISITTATVTGVGTISTSVNSVILPAGNYWIFMNANSTANGSFDCHNYFQGGSGVGDAWATVSSEPVLSGTLAIVADTPLATFDPTSISRANKTLLLARFDN